MLIWRRLGKVRETILADPFGVLLFSTSITMGTMEIRLILQEHEALARSMFKEETGLLEPEYTISKTIRASAGLGKPRKYIMSSPKFLTPVYE